MSSSQGSQTPIREFAVPAVERLLQSAIETAQKLTYPTVVEVSDRSESVYLHIQRGDLWRGFRIACHEPFYACSADYTQMIIPRSISEPDWAHYDRYLRQAVQAGGKVVADPSEVAAMIEREAIRRTVPGKPIRLSAIACCEIRHRLNYLASWSAELIDAEHTEHHEAIAESKSRIGPASHCDSRRNPE